MVKPVLVFGYGNLSRGDDALGPLLLEYVEHNLCLDDIELLVDFQLQIEHALDLQHRSLVLFVDASIAIKDPINFSILEPYKDKSYSTHAMSPASVLVVYESIHKQPSPPSFLLSIKGEQFELGEPLSVNAQQHLTIACQFAETLINNLAIDFWHQQL